jgi:hypothetical protein
MGKMGKRFLTAKFAEGAEVEGKKHETRSSKSAFAETSADKSETKFNLPKEESACGG